jgi:pyruvate,orthophosphate dikinase
MKKNIISNALEANLAETRYKDIKISPEYQEFINLSKKYYGIHKRANDCIVEFQHPYSNKKFVVEELRKILITDYWFYIKLDDPEKAFKIPLKLLNTLLCDDQLDSTLKVFILRTMLEFTQKVYLEKPDYSALVALCCSYLHQGFDKNRQSYIEASKYFKRYLKEVALDQAFAMSVLEMVRQVYGANIDFWENISRVEQWLKSRTVMPKQQTKRVSNHLGKAFFVSLRAQLKSVSTWDELVNSMPDYDQLADRFAQSLDLFDSFIDKFYFVFYLLSLKGMADHRDRLIWQLNKMLVQTMEELENDHVLGFIDQVFYYAEELKGEHTSSVLDIFLTVGKKVVDIDRSEDKALVRHLENRLIDFGFETPGMVYVNEDWQLNINPNHIKNIRVWLELIEYSQSEMEKLLSALIVNLKLGGIFISDTDLFQREITKILNSNIAPFYKKVKQLTRIFPVYFNEIGAEGDIRKVTTTMDELSQREDKLIHFLRKQVHTESNNTLIGLTRRIFQFWCDADLRALKDYLPQNVFESIRLDGPWFAPIHELVKQLCAKAGCKADALLSMDAAPYEALLSGLPQADARDIERLRDIRNLYAFLKEKYSFETVDIIRSLKRYSYIPDEKIDQLRIALNDQDIEHSLKLIYDFMNQLKAIIFNPKPSKSWENIYHKRHIAIGIPSMYGVYREPKFEALGLTFRLEKVATRLMEKVVDNINLNYISGKTLRNIYGILDYFREGLALDGITNQSFNSNLLMLKYSLASQSFSFNQYINIFQFVADNVKNTLVKYFLKTYEIPLQVIVPQLYDKENKLTDKQRKAMVHRVSEEFYRDTIAEAFLMQPLDNFILKILESLRNMADNLPPEMIKEVMSYNSDLIIARLAKANPVLDNQVFLGSKAYHLKILRMAKFPVPPGFVLTTEAFRRHQAIMSHAELQKEFYQLIREHLALVERASGKEFGNPDNPLLLSVRSGTAISMPGAMDTLLNVGMNDEITESLSNIPGFEWSAWDSYRRLLQSWGMAYGRTRDEFDEIINHFKEKYQVGQKGDFSPAIMREVAFAYKKRLKDAGIYFEEDVFKQLTNTINLVFESWSSVRAIVYREHLQIADEWGTAVIVQEMIFGNKKSSSGSGVIFTQNPKSQRQGVHLYGDFTFQSQGEDIVAGLVKPHPVSKAQLNGQREHMVSLEEMYPDLYKRLYSLAVNLTENMGYNPQEIEFTFESEHPDDLYILQIRDMDMASFGVVDRFKRSVEKMSLAGRGIGIGGGALNGRIAIDMDDINRLHEQYPGEAVVLVRPDTVPDDIGMIFETDALLTAKGGATSHAAVTAVRLGKTSVVNCTGLLVYENEKYCKLNKVVFHVGDKIAIDGYLGNVYKGNYPIESSKDHREFRF